MVDGVFQENASLNAKTSNGLRDLKPSQARASGSLGKVPQLPSPCFVARGFLML